ncbi:hypothetical protein HPO96_29355 [Kribbella sandramycini]|uniref:Pycsar effector protein domain-containing protein n=1 Tax=Kribbella sandramycini TaxID=60450 RepID=A0A7Y4L4U4_9ACTN|nr:Pycsar system effector family protein [Kribbella sandramycini]MBB6571719.1 hypothetical protein [Kribbella sandramycini]NOL44362.1 hypothetical protein [Kribbella sandramycini]
MSEHSVIDLAWRMYDSAAAAVDRADTKAGFAATLETAAAAVVLTLLSQAHGAPVVVRVLLGLALVSFGVALVAAMLVVTPRMKAPGLTLVPGEFLYFGAVRVRSTTQIRKHIDPSVHGGLIARPTDAVIYQAKQLAGIAWTKHRYARWSLQAAAAGALLTTVAVLGGGAS